MSITTSASDLGRELYHAIWQLVGQTFFDTKRLFNWHSREHQFDHLIVDEETALRYTDEMLASLGDTYTERVIAAPEACVNEETAASTAEPSEIHEPVLAVLRPDGIGYLQILAFDRADIFDLVAAGVQKIAHCTGVILDLRNNSGGRMHETLASCGLFLNDGLLATLEIRDENGGMITREYALSPTEFFANVTYPNGSEISEMYERPAPVLAGKPLVILIGNRTASSAELMTAALVQNGEIGKVCMVGNGETRGKGIGQAEYEVFGGRVKIRVTRTRWLTPGGDWLGDCGQTERNGIAPDTIVLDDRGMEGLQAAFRELRRMLDASIPEV
jgi:C-terminal processing protease CtpA/Prc